MSSIGHVAFECTRGLLAGLLAVALVPGNTAASPPIVANAQAQTPASADTRIPPDQLDSLVAPIALYPDPLLAQTLAASTYPLELLQLHQWLAKNPGLKDKALLDAVSRQPWDPSIQAMAAVPDVVKWLAEDIQWTTDLGNAFLAQQNDVMDAVQRMRFKAENNGTLQSTPQQTVETRVVENKSVVVIEQANPEVLYVPSYNPTVVYGAPIYPYPPIYYPPAGYYAGRAIAFGTGLAIGSAWNGGWGWGANWGHNDITVNRFNSFNRNAYASGRYTGNTWQHRAEHRGGAPYRDRATANRYGGAARGDSLAARQSGARQQIQRQGGTARSAGTTGLQNRAAGAGVGQRGQGNIGGRAGTGMSGRPSSSLGTRTGGVERVGGSRDISRPSGSSNRGAFSGGYDRYNGSSARANANRGSSSVRSSRSYGGSRSGGFSGGGRSRGGGGGGGRSRGGGRR